MARLSRLVVPLVALGVGGLANAGMLDAILPLDGPQEPEGYMSSTNPWSKDYRAAEDERQEIASIYYRNCDAARAAGAAPILYGQPGYRDILDGDGDGVACEPYRGR